MHFTLIDWVIVIAYLAVSLGIGLYGRKFVGGVDDFLVAGRHLGVHVGVATLAATEIGTVTFMYYSQLGYQTGFASFVNGLIAGVVMIFIGQTGFVVRRLRTLRLMTMPEYFELRYSRNLRILTGILVATGGILGMGVFIRVEGTFLLLVTGISLHYLKIAMAAILLLEFTYTVLGGMMSIVITDFLQYSLLSISTIVVTAYCLIDVGWGRMTRTVWTLMGANGFNPIRNPEFGWLYILFQTLLWIAGDTCWQTTAMRTFSTRNPETSQRVFLWTGFIFLGRGLMPMLWGIAALTVLGPGQDSLNAMPIFLSHLLPSGFLGLVVAGMLAATMSVNSSYLLGWSSIIAQDVIAPLWPRKITSKRQVMVNRIVNLLVSGFVFFWGLWYTIPGPVYFYLTVTGTIFLAGTLSAVLAGLYWKKANVLGGYCAMLGGVFGAIFFFFFHVSTGLSGVGAFVFAGSGLVLGSLIGIRRAKSQELLADS